MDKSTQDRIFDPFFTTKGENGTGLGLSQVYGFVERSDGAIQVYSKIGHGTRFTLYFPRSFENIDDKHNSPAIPEISLKGNETILVVDDEPGMLELARDILTNQGYHVQTAHDGIQALSILEKRPVDLVLSDVIMPNLDGFQLASQIQKLHPNTKILMTSGFTNDRHNTLETDMPFKNILLKPYTSSTLLEYVRNRLNEDKYQPVLDGRTVMVLDDDHDVRELFKINLNRLGCRVIPASTSEEAITLYKQSMDDTNGPIDIVILDLTIPGDVSGVVVAEKIRAINEKARLIVCSGHTNTPEVSNYHDFGFNAMINKDFNRDKIRQALEDVISTD